MQSTVYIETSVISYLTNWPSRDLIVAAHQDLTKEWWQSYLPDTQAYISRYVIEEITAGDPVAAQLRVNAVKHLPSIPEVQGTVELANRFIAAGQLPEKAMYDALHIALATLSNIDILLTWNCKHIANPTQLPKMRALCEELGYRLPELVTPLAMMEINT
jgi:hypothetical protein